MTQSGQPVEDPVAFVSVRSRFLFGWHRAEDEHRADFPGNLGARARILAVRPGHQVEVRLGTATGVAVAAEPLDQLRFTGEPVTGLETLFYNPGFDFIGNLKGSRPLGFVRWFSRCQDVPRDFGSNVALSPLDHRINLS